MILSSSYDIVFLGLTITSSWGNGHATTYRGLIRELAARGHHVLFLERDVPWYASNRDMPVPPFGRTELYGSVKELREKWTSVIQSAELVVVGSYVPEGVAVGEWVTHTAHGVTAFYDIDTPVTISKLLRREHDYLAPHLIPQFELYLSFAGGPILTLIEESFGSPLARPFYCSVDSDIYYPQERNELFDLGYMGTFSHDRQPPLERMMLDAARKWDNGRFVVAGPQYPESVKWPANTTRVEHVSPVDHRGFYCSQRFTLNLTRADMVQAGYSPSVRLFEAAACGTPIISDYWEGLNTFFDIGEEILLSDNADHTLRYLLDMSESERKSIGERARKRVLSEHTSRHRAEQLEYYIVEARRARRVYNMMKPRMSRRA